MDRFRINPYAHVLQILEQGALLGSVLRTLAPLGVAIAECGARIQEAGESPNPEYTEVVTDVQTTMIENLLGVAFVVCQTYIEEVISWVHVLHERKRADTHCGPDPAFDKPVILRLGPPATSNYSSVEVMNAFANYFKHGAEWRHDWNKLKGRQHATATVIMAVGAKRGSSGNLRAGAAHLGNASYANVDVFRRILEQWRRAVHNTCYADLERNQLL
jgi:hypothetical protein